MLHLALQPCHKVTKSDFQSEFSMSKIWLFFLLAFLKRQNHHQILMTLALFIKRTKQQDWKVFQLYRLRNLKLPSALCAGGLFRALYSAQELLQLLNFQTIYYKNKSVFFILNFWRFPNLCTKDLWYTYFKSSHLWRPYQENFKECIITTYFMKKAYILYISCGRVIRDFEREAKTRCNF